MVKNLKHYWVVGLDSSKEGFCCTEFKNVSSSQRTVSEKIKKNRPKIKILAIFTILEHFDRFFLIFLFETILCRELKFFALHSVHQKTFFWAIKINNLTIFLKIFHHKGGSLWFRVGEGVSGHCLIRKSKIDSGNRFEMIMSIFLL